MRSATGTKSGPPGVVPRHDRATSGERRQRCHGSMIMRQHLQAFRHETSLVLRGGARGEEDDTDRLALIGGTAVVSRRAASRHLTSPPCAAPPRDAHRRDHARARAAGPAGRDTLQESGVPLDLRPIPMGLCSYSCGRGVMPPTLGDASAACSIRFLALPAPCIGGQRHSIKGRGGVSDVDIDGNHTL
jgi:hypothetical protein